MSATSTAERESVCSRSDLTVFDVDSPKHTNTHKSLLISNKVQHFLTRMGMLVISSYHTDSKSKTLNPGSRNCTFRKSEMWENRSLRVKLEQSLKSKRIL